MSSYYVSNNQNYSHNHKKNHKRKIMRFTVLLALLLVSFTLGALIDVFAKEDTPFVAIEEEIFTIDVEAGDTLWNIAQTHAPEHTDVRKYLSKIIKINDLDGHLIHAGQILIMP